jgi:hypothetical protein
MSRTMKARIFVLPLLLAVVAVSGCGGGGPAPKYSSAVRTDFFKACEHPSSPSQAGRVRDLCNCIVQTAEDNIPSGQFWQEAEDEGAEVAKITKECVTQTEGGN